MPNINIPQQKTSPKSKEFILSETRKKLLALVFAYAEKFKQLGIKVTDDCRVDMDNFQNIYSPQIIEKDKKYINDRQSKFEKKDPSEDIGEAVELLTTIIWNKILGNNLIVVRTTMFDDIANGVDHLVVEKTTGKVVCFIDEVASLDSLAMHKKKEHTPAKKDIKYGFSIEDGKITLKELKNIPVFYLGTPGSQLNDISKDLASSINSNPTKKEQALMTFYLGSLALQIMERSLEKDAKELLKLIPETILSEMKKFTQKTKAKK